MPNYFYYYDRIATQKKYEEGVKRLEMQLIDLGINGKYEHFSPLTNIKRSLEEAIEGGCHTAVAVGDDETFVKFVSLVAHYDIAMGFVPVHDASIWARIFDLPVLEKSVETISKRLMKKIDLGKINQSYFIGSVMFPTTNDVKIFCDEKYTVSTHVSKTQAGVYNILNAEHRRAPFYDPEDGKLDLLVESEPARGLQKIFRKTLPSPTHLFIKKAKITSSVPVPLKIDGHLVLKTPAHIEIKSKKLKLIVGKNRLI